MGANHSEDIKHLFSNYFDHLSTYTLIKFRKMAKICKVTYGGRLVLVQDAIYAAFVLTTVRIPRLDLQVRSDILTGPDRFGFVVTHA